MVLKRKRLRNLNVTFVSMLKLGANQQRALVKGEDGGVTMTCLTKTGLKGELYSLVMVPEIDDSDGESISKEEVVKACHSHAANGLNTDLRHDCKALGKEQVQVVENSILTHQDDRYPQVDRHGNPVNHVGAWGQVRLVKDPDLLAQVEAGELTEVSIYAPPGGYEQYEEAVPVSKSQTPRSTMDPEELQKALAKSNTGLAGEIIAGLAAVLKPVTDSLAKAEADKTAAAEALAKEQADQAEAVRKAQAEANETPKYDFVAGTPPLFKGQITNPAHVTAFAHAKEDYILGMATTQAIESGNDEGLAKCQAKQAEVMASRAGVSVGSNGNIDFLAGIDSLGKTQKVIGSGGDHLGGDFLTELAKDAEAGALN